MPGSQKFSPRKNIRCLFRKSLSETPPGCRTFSYSAFAKRKTERSSKIEVIRADYNANDKNVNHFVLEIEHTDNEVISQRKIKMAGLTHEESEIHTYWVLIFLYFLTIFLSNIIFIFYFFEILWCVNIFRCSGVAECSSLFRSTWFQHITSNKKSTTLNSTK